MGHAQMGGDTTRGSDLQLHVERFAKNIARTHELVSIFRLLTAGKGRKSALVSDILRSAVVFLHASLEDFLRSIAYVYLPHAEPEVISSIPLKGISPFGRPQKFLLGQLVEHRHKTIGQLIEESVVEYLEKSNYNHTNDIAALLRQVGIDVSAIDTTFPDLDKMMARRHQIVHRADWTETSTPGKHRVHPLRAADVERWINVIVDFQSKVLHQLQVQALADEPSGS